MKKIFALAFVIALAIFLPTAYSSTGYPEDWPDDIPKMDGRVIDVTPITDASDGGYSVTLEGKNIKEVMSYVKLLKSKGFESPFEDDDDDEDETWNVYICSLQNEAYSMRISFTEKSKEVVIAFVKE